MASVSNSNNPGMGIKGFMPKAAQLTDKRYPEYEQIRFTLKNSWNNHYNSQLKSYNTKSGATPFRAVNNAGDLLGRQHFSCGGSCQTPQSRPGLKGLKGHMGSITSNCSKKDQDIPVASCNVKYVYDSSNYTTYLKQRAVNKNYNDLSNSSNDYNSSQSALRFVRGF